MGQVMKDVISEKKWLLSQSDVKFYFWQFENVESEFPKQIINPPPVVQDRIVEGFTKQ